MYASLSFNVIFQGLCSLFVHSCACLNLMTTKARFNFWGSSNAAPTYTPAEKKGEINDLRVQLRDPVIEKDNTKRRDLLKKVLGLMTLGVDTSGLFTEMILACVTKDLVQKKMIYFYLCTHSETNSDIAILAVNTLQKDCRDESPLVRGLALRSLASLRLAQLAEYLVPTLKQCLVDTAPYVRKTAILATLKLYRISPDSFASMGLKDKMYGMLRDNDALVSMNALAVLEEVTAEDGGLQVTKSILYFLLNRLRDVPEWQQTQILRLCLLYTPANEDEMFDIMNLLEERLLGSNSAVIIGCSHVFLHLTQNLPAVHRQVFDRLKEPLLTLMSASPSIETSYAILCHIKLLVQREPKVFQASYKDFFCRHSEPTFMKSVKMDILTFIATESSVTNILSELSAYASESNHEIARQAISSMGRLALRIEGSAKTVMVHFLEFLALDVEHVRGQTLVVMKDFLRKHSDISMVRPFLTALVKSYQDMHFEDEESRVALVWVLGEFGEHIDDSPYLLESFTTNLVLESHVLRMEMLTSCMKLFFKRPPEMQPVLAAVFRQLINDFSHADVHDRALFYYRLLRHNVRAAAQVVGTPKASVASYVEDDTSDLRDKLFEEFNSLSVIYATPSSVFNRKVEEPESDSESSDEESEDDEDNEEGLLSGALELTDDVNIEPAEFQQKWAKLPLCQSIPVKLKAPLTSAEALEESLEDYNLFTMASGAQGANTKFYLYAREEGETSTHFLVELVVQNSNGTGTATVKTDSANGPAFAELFKKIISKF